MFRSRYRSSSSASASARALAGRAAAPVNSSSSRDVYKRQVKLDPDEFDLNFYTYGLSVYGNLPLIEPLETRESKKIEELALVIDTSYSTSCLLYTSRCV